MERLYLPKLNRLHPTLESTVLKVVEESGELARAVLQHLADPAAKTPASLDEVAAELLDVAQTCVTMIFVLEDEYGLRCEEMVDVHLAKLRRKNYLLPKRLNIGSKIPAPSKSCTCRVCRFPGSIC